MGIFVKKLCKVENCTNSHLAKGYCIKHYNQMRKRGYTYDSKALKYCQVSGCTDRYFAKNYCVKHYEQIRKHGRIFDLTQKSHRPAIIEGEIAKIPLGIGAKEGYAIVDKKFAHLDQYNWHTVGKKKHHKCRYAQATINGKSVLLHRLIANTPDDFDTDHINHNTLDNRVENLQILDPHENRSGFLRLGVV